MSFFDLPFDIRDRVWRRARFESARDSVKRKLANRTQVVEHYITMSDLLVKVYLRIHQHKMLSIGYSRDCTMIEVKDSSRVHLFCRCADTHVRVLLLTDYSTQNIFYSKHTIDHVPRKTCTYEGWCPYVCPLDKIAQGTTTTKVYKYE